MNPVFIQKMLYWCGIGHFALCLGSLIIPKALQWNAHLKSLQPFYRQMFWTYAAYILAVNFWFGLISFFGTAELSNHSFLAKGATLFIASYWLARIFIQLFYFDKSQAPRGFIFTAGEIALISVFFIFSVSYSIAFLFNIAWI